MFYLYVDTWVWHLGTYNMLYLFKLECWILWRIHDIGWVGLLLGSSWKNEWMIMLWLVLSLGKWVKRSDHMIKVGYIRVQHFKIKLFSWSINRFCDPRSLHEDPSSRYKKNEVVPNINWHLVQSIHKRECSLHLRLQTPKNSSLHNLTVIGHTHGLEKAWLLVLANHPHHNLPLALHTNLIPTWTSLLHGKSTSSIMPWTYPSSHHSRLNLGCENLCNCNPLINHKIQEIITQSF
jgi:hypothetical protein